MAESTRNRKTTFKDLPWNIKMSKGGTLNSMYYSKINEEQKSFKAVLEKEDLKVDNINSLTGRVIKAVGSHTLAETKTRDVLVNTRKI